MDSRQRCHVRVPAAVLLLSLAALAASAILAPRAYATPAYARRYDTKCETCHSPLPPRLNNTGMLFRRFGFRLPDADESGKLTLNTIPAHSISDAASLVAEFDGRWDQIVGPGESKSTLEMGEVAVVAGTSVAKHLSAQAVFLPRNSEGGAELEGAEMQGNFGAPGGQWTVRAGLLEPNLWMKGTHGTITLEGPLVFGETSSVPVGDFGGFGLGHNQVGVEGGFTYTRLHKGKMCATMLTAAILNGVDGAGDPASRNATDGAARARRRSADAAWSASVRVALRNLRRAGVA